MADKETGLNIPVSAYADENSAKDAVKDLQKGVLSSLKDGYIAIPAEIKVPIKNASKDLQKAQKDVIQQWNETFKEGFSSSEKDLNNLVEVYRRFLKLARSEHKTGTKQYRGITNMMGGQIQSYTTQKQIREQKLAEHRANLEAAKTKQKNKQATRKKQYDLPSDEEINADIKKEEKRNKKANDAFVKNLTKGASRGKASSVGASINLGVRRPNMDDTYLSEKGIITNDRVGTYYGRNSLERQTAFNKKEEDKKSRKNLTSITPSKETFNEMLNEALSKGNNANKFSDQEKYSNYAKLAADELAKILGGLESNKPDVSIKNFDDYLKNVLALNSKAGKQNWDGISLALNETLHRYFNTNGTIGATNGNPKGVGAGHNNAEEALLGMVDHFKKVLENNSLTEALTSINRTLARIDPNSLNQRNTVSGNILDREIQNINRNQNSQLSSLEHIERLTSIEGARESTADAKESRISTENKDINRDVAKAVKVDADTGFNTDNTANRLIEICSSILTNIESIIEILQQNSKPDSKTRKSRNISNKIKDSSEFNKMIKNSATPPLIPNIKDTLSLIPEPDMSKALVKIPGEFAKTLKESIHPNVLDANRINEEQNKQAGQRRLEIEESRLQRLADQANARKAQNKSRGDAGDRIPNVIIPGQPLYSNQVQKSSIYASPINQTIWDKFEQALKDATGITDKYRDVMNKTADEQDQMAAERIKNFGMNNGRNPNDTGDIASIKRSLELFRTNKTSIEQNPELFQKIKLTPGVEVDTTEITEKLSKALSGKQMRNAQMGGSIPRQILGMFTGFVGMPSLERSRAQADGLNQILGNVNKALQSVLINIQMKETELAGMEKSGQARFTSEGYITPDSSSAAKKTLADLEEEKLVLASILADMKAVDQVVGQTGGKFSKLAKQLSFTSPVLRENNGILRNINSGLDKNGKALKYQTRLAEILNYTFQLASRAVGQMLKNWLVQLNPITQIKKLFQDFMSYDIKWQRTMNVIKYNLRDIIRPFMEWIAQTLVNIIGFLDIISMKIQEAFGYTPISLFDQENANDMKNTYEEIASITAGFDELHDVGSSSGENDPDNLLGEIYKPKLSQAWIDLANEIGDLFAGIITGDLGFGDVMKKILEIAWEGIQQIWEWFKNTEVGQWLIKNWKKLLATILALFLGWKLLKIAGSTLFNALFGKITSGSIGKIFSKVGGWITKALNLTSFGRGILEGFTSVFTGSGGLISTLKSIFVGHDAITAFGAWGETLGAVFVQSLGVIVGIGLAALGISKGFDMNADNTSYNLGLMQNGGNEEDKKSNFWGTALGTVSGGVGGAIAGSFLAGASVGGPVGAVIGAIAGLLITSLAPAFEKATVKAKEMNNEMQKIEYYQGAVDGAQTEVDELTEYMDLLNQTLDIQKQKVIEEGEQLGISTSRMNELVTAVEDGTFSTGMLSGKEVELTNSLVSLSEQQEKSKEVTERLTEAKKKLEKASVELSIAQDVEAGNFELAAARIEYAEASGVMSTEEATAKRIQLYKEAGKEERDNLLQDLTPEQRKLMLEYVGATEKETKELKNIYDDLEDHTRSALLDGIDQNTVNEFDRRMNSMDTVLAQHSGFWQKTLDVLTEIFTLGFADTYTFNGEDKYYKDAAKDVKAGNAYKYSEETLEELRRRGLISSYAVGTNYVPNDGLAYLHQGEAVIPKKYNQPYQPVMSAADQATMYQMMNTLRSLDNTMKQGISVNGQFVQRGSDLVAVVNKTKSRTGADLLSNVAYAR